MNNAAPQPVSDEVPCSTHPDAPHGFNRNGSHSLDRYVCDCEGWVPPVSDDVAKDALVDALEQITSMTYDKWTNGAVASRIAEEALAAYRAAQEKPHD